MTQAKSNPFRGPFFFFILAFVCFMLPTVLAHKSHQQGNLLVAARSMNPEDPYFPETVLYIVRYDLLGAMALVVNRPHERGEGLFWGGPVPSGGTYVLHSSDVPGNELKDAKNGLALSKDDTGLLRRIRDGQGPRRNKLFKGMAGWAPLQLDREVLRGIWHIIPYDEALVFSDNPETVWQIAIERAEVLETEERRKKDWEEKEGKKT